MKCHLKNSWVRLWRLGYMADILCVLRILLFILHQWESHGDFLNNTFIYWKFILLSNVELSCPSTITSLVLLTPFPSQRHVPLLFVNEFIECCPCAHGYEAIHLGRQPTSDFPSLSNYWLPIAPLPGVDLDDPPAVLEFWLTWSWVGNFSCCEFMSAIVFSCPKVSISQISSLSSNFTFFLPLLLGFPWALNVSGVWFRWLIHSWALAVIYNQHFENYKFLY